MATAFTLHVIAAQDINHPPALTLGTNKAHIVTWISRASNGELGFTVVQHASSQMSSNGVNAATLQLMFNEIVTSPPPGVIARDLGLILCRDWVVKGTLNGLMFDYEGADPLLGTTFHSEGTPRQACALFLNPLAGDSDEYISRAALHELGHVFNLVHDAGGGSFMATPRPGMGYKDADAVALERAGAGISPDDKIHLPGLSNFDAMQPNLMRSAGAKHGASHQAGHSVRSPLRLTVLLAKDRYLLGEIVTLEMHLRLSRGEAQILCQLDPGYDRLRIWYETPLGERRLYRPFVRMCASRSNGALVTASKPLVNNPRVSVGHRGTVFRWSGHYRIWAELSLPGAAASLVSNCFEFDVYMPRRDQERELCAVLTRPDNARFLAQKGGVLSRTSWRQLNDVAHRHRNQEATKHVRYALAHQLFRMRNRKRAFELLKGLRFRLPSLQDGLERLRNAVTERPK